MIFFENVKTMASSRRKDGKQRPIDIQNGALAKLGFQCHWGVMKSEWMGLRQSRSRTWAVYWRREHVTLRRRESLCNCTLQLLI